MNPPEAQNGGVAIVGMAGRFPGAKNLEEFWRNLQSGVESISFFKDEEVQWSLLDGPPPKGDPRFVKARAVLEDPDLFDAAFFNVNPKEAEVMDPQHRVFLECAWEALEDAGYNADTYEGLIGVFAGSSMSTYLLANLLTHRDLISLVGVFQTMLGNDKDYLPTRVSYKLNLKGPSLNVQTACSTSLVAVCLACQNLLNYQCDMALAGGVSITFPQKKGQLHQEGGIISPDGHCRAFDADAAGTVPGDGVGIVVLKRLSDALQDGDHICAVIKGCAINNDGSFKIGYTAPSIEGQAQVIAMAHADAGADPETISYVEAHGTATPLGDPIEIAGLTKAFRAGTAGKGFCAIGSLKSNLGHLDAAAGVAGLIKTVLALQHKQLPPSLHFRRPNPKIDFASSPFYVNTALKEWKRGDTPRRAGVSSFGIGGTNAHAVLEEAPITEPPGKSRPWQLLVLSAKTGPALESVAKNLAEHLKKHPDANLADAAFTLQTGRKAFAHRRVLVCSGVNDAAVAVETCDPKRVFTRIQSDAEPPVVFMFPGQGAQQVNMGRELYESEPVFREQIDQCSEILRSDLKFDLRTILYPETGGAGATSEQLTQTMFAQPALFVVEYALARLWMSWGVHPQAMIGHSIGEYVAACLAGVFAVKDALALVAARGKLVQKQPTGTMLAVRLPEQEVRPLLGRRLSLAAVNAPNLCVASGPTDAVDSLEKKLAERGAACRRLHTSHAFHSEIMEPVLRPFTARVRKMSLSPPQIPFLSNVSGRWITEQEAIDPGYWAAHLRQTVRFSDGLAELMKEQNRILLEVGPGQTLSTLARQHPARNSEQSVLSSFATRPEHSEEVRCVLTALGYLWLSGVTVDWKGFYAREHRHRLPLPTYPFERKRYWIEPGLDEADRSLNGARQSAPAQMSGEESTQNYIESPVAARDSEAGRSGSLETLKTVFQELSGVNLAKADIAATFLELGFDSLFLTQASQLVQKRFAAIVTFRQLLEEFQTLEKLAAHLDALQLQTARSNGPVPLARAPDLEHRPEGSGRGNVGAGTLEVKTIPLTDAQREIWFASQMGAAVSTAYNESCTLPLSGPLQVEVLRRVIQQLVDRHETLRATFSPSGQTQQIANTARVDVPLTDLSNLEERDREMRVREVIDEAVSREFDLVEGPMLRAQIVRLAADRHLFVLVAHHIVCDGWSMSVLLYESGELYSAISRGAPGALAAPLQFSDYAQREVGRQQSPEFAAAEAYWVKQFSDSVPVLELPGDRPRPASRTYVGAHQARPLKPELTAALKRFSAEHNSTTFTTLLAAFSVLLHRLSGQDDIVVGVPAAGQAMGGARHLVGHCANLLPMRSRFDASQKFSDYLAALRRAVLDAFDHHQYPFGSLIRKLNLPRDPNRVPLANVSFNVGRSRGTPNFEGLAVAVARNPKRFVNFDINFNVTETDDDISLDCYYSTELFDATTMERWLGHYERLLEGIVGDAEESVGELPLLSEDQRQQLLVEWNNTQTDYPREQCLHQLFCEQAARTPEAVALVWGEQRLTYQELDRRSRALAQQLQRHGVRPEVPVGVCIERSPGMVVALLGILRAGGAYVPLDPAYPRERLAFMLEDSRAPVLLTQRSLRESLNFETTNRLVVCLDELDVGDKGTLRSGVRSGNLSYVIYTSGSTGKPKGVAITHRSAVALVHWARSVYTAEELAGVLASTSICFDLSVFELFVPLSWGGTVILAENALALPTLAGWKQVTLINTVPSAITELLRVKGIPDSVRTVNLAGEPLSTRLVQQLYAVPGIQRVFDLYGPSEDTTYSTWALRNAEGPATIGRPIANTQVYILDRHLQPMPVGVPGELCIGGDGLARGYLHRPELTAEKFVRNPFSQDPSARIYRTGDRARFRPEGNIEFLGRMDHQVKVRGYRIELEEIESVLGEHPAVQDVVAVAREDQPGNARLVAYLVPHNEDMRETELREFLRRKLPDYMIPSVFVQLDKLPLTPSGKVDRRRLPVPDVARTPSNEPYVVPRTPAEATLAQIWCEVLGVKQVGMFDNFFELGGHSLLVTQVVSRVREAFQVDLPMRRLFEAPTVAGLAAALEVIIVHEVDELSEDEARRFADSAS